MFENLEEYYEYLERDSSLLFDSSLSNRVLNLRDRITDNESKIYCSNELFFTAYTFINGKISPKISNASGEIYPSFALFEDNLTYIKSRAEKITNPKYKAKYNHLLWESGLKHNKYAEQAIDNYFCFLHSNCVLLNDNLSCYAFENYFKNLFILSQSVNYKKTEVIQFLISNLEVNKINGCTQYSLIKFIIEEGKKIDQKSLQVFFEYSDKVINNSVYPDFTQEYLQLLIILCQKLNKSPKIYHNKLAEYYIDQSKDKEENFVVHDFYLKALTQYQKAVNKNKIEEVTVLIEKAKRNINFKTVKVEHTDDMLQTYWELIIKMTDQLIQKESEDIYKYIMFSERIFPKAEVLNKNVRPVMFDLVSVINFDINKNVNNKQNSGVNPYFLHIQNFSIQHLWMVFLKGIKNEKISFNSLIAFLKNHSWYGQDFTFINADGEKEGFNWIELLSPSLMIFFTQSEIDIKQNKNSNEGYILAIDSLVIKFEGLLREFSRNIGAQTIEIKENGTEERISFEKLLENEKIKNTVPEDDIALFKFLFTSTGMNLRNNIAHCFYKTDNYSAGIMFLLIAALLKLGNYKFSTKAE